MVTRRKKPGQRTSPQSFQLKPGGGPSAPPVEGWGGQQQHSLKDQSKKRPLKEGEEPLRMWKRSSGWELLSNSSAEHLALDGLIHEKHPPPVECGLSNNGRTCCQAARRRRRKQRFLSNEVICSTSQNNGKKPKLYISAQQDRDVSTACTNHAGGVPQQARSTDRPSTFPRASDQWWKTANAVGVTTPRAGVIPPAATGYLMYKHGTGKTLVQV